MYPCASFKEPLALVVPNSASVVCRHTSSEEPHGPKHEVKRSFFPCIWSAMCALQFPRLNEGGNWGRMSRTCHRKLRIVCALKSREREGLLSPCQAQDPDLPHLLRSCIYAFKLLQQAVLAILFSGGCDRCFAFLFLRIFVHKACD